MTLSDLMIRTKPPNVRLVPLVPNETQELYLADIRRECPSFDPTTAEGSLEGLRVDVLKYRQWGCSTITLCLYLMDTLNNEMTNTRVLAHNPTTTVELFSIVRVAYEHIPEHKRPALRYDSEERMEFANGSRFSVLQVGSKGAGRGGTIKNLLMSERAFWPSNGDDIEFGLLQAVPIDGNIVRETTANGMNEYYQQYKAAEAGEAPNKAFFYGWAPHKEYAMPVPANFVPDAEEKKLQAGYGLTDGQLMFRRVKIKEARRLGKDFRQEYPLTAQEAFVASGNPRFNREYLYNVVLARVNQPDWAAERIEQKGGDVHWHGTVTTYVDPEKRKRYLITVDTAKGLTEGGKADYSVAHVYDLHTYEQVCHYRGQMGEHDFAEDLSILGKMYNNALIAVETPGPGEVVLGFLIHTIHYPAVYYYDDMIDQDGNPKSVPGYPMNSTTKPESEGYLASFIEDGARGEPTIIFRHPNTVEELIHYVKLRGDKCGAESGGHDDECTCARIFACLIPKYGLRGRPVVKAVKSKKAGYGQSSRLVRGRM